MRDSELRALYARSGGGSRDPRGILAAGGLADTAEHLDRVADKAAALAAEWGEEPEAARLAGLFHDVSALVPDGRKLEAAEHFGLEVLDAERACPMLLHQHLSAEIARRYFGLADETVLGAIACHTTLKAAPKPLDLILFIADKLAWDREGDPPYLGAVTAGLATSLARGALAYIDHLLANRAALRALHPWLLEARESLEAAAEKGEVP